MGYLGDSRLDQKSGRFERSGNKKVGEWSFGSKMGAETGILGKYLLGAWEFSRKKSGRLGDSDPPSRASYKKTSYQN